MTVFYRSIITHVRIHIIKILSYAACVFLGKAKFEGMRFLPSEICEIMNKHV